MDMFEYGKALADLWALGGKAFMSGQDSAVRAFTDGVAKAATQPFAGLLPSVSSDAEALSKSSQTVMGLWSSAAELSAALAQRLAVSNGSESAMGSVLGKMLDPRAWTSGSGELDELLQRLAEGPRFADMWNVERKYVRVFQAWLTLRRRSLEHTTVVLEAWLKAANAFADRLGSITVDNRQPALKEALDLWVETANQALLETQHSDRFLQTQAELLKASTDLRFAQRELTEYYSHIFGFPTRTELDDVHRTVTELKRELRATRRRQALPATSSDLSTTRTRKPRS